MNTLRKRLKKNTKEIGIYNQNGVYEMKCGFNASFIEQTKNKNYAIRVVEEKHIPTEMKDSKLKFLIANTSKLSTSQQN